MKRIISTIVGTLLLSSTCFGQFYIEYEQNFRSEENSLNFIYNLTSGNTTSVPASPLLAEALPVPGNLPLPGPSLAANNASVASAESPVYAAVPETVYASAESPVYAAVPEPVYASDEAPVYAAVPEPAEPVAGPDPVIITEQVFVPDPVTVVLDPIVITEPVYLTEKVIEYIQVASPAPVVIPKPVESVAAAVSPVPDASQLVNILQTYDPDQLSEILQEAHIFDHLLKPRYRMYRTDAASVQLKLDTATGAVWQVQQGDGASRPMVSPIDAKSLLRYSEPEESGRYELCPTDNIYSFILLDTKDGYSYQVKWGEDAGSRARILIGR